MCAPGPAARWRLWRATSHCPVPGDVISRFRRFGFPCDDRPKRPGLEMPRIMDPVRRRSTFVPTRDFRRLRRPDGVDPAHLTVDRIGDLAWRKRRPLLI